MPKDHDAPANHSRQNWLAYLNILSNSESHEHGTERRGEARVRTDLEALGLAAGFGPRYGPEDVGAFTGYGLAGLLLAGWGTTPIGQRLPGLGMGLFFAVGAAVWAFYARRNLQRRVHPAARLREARLMIGFTTLFCTALLGCLAWAHWQGLSRAVAAGAAFALGGLLAAVLGMTDRWRRLWLGFAGTDGRAWPSLADAAGAVVERRVRRGLRGWGRGGGRHPPRATPGTLARCRGGAHPCP